MKIENGVLINVCDEDIKNGTLVVPSGVKKIDKEVFEYNHAESVILPKTLKEISQYAFARMPYLKEITIPKGVKKLNQTHSGVVKISKRLLLEARKSLNLRHSLIAQNLKM